MSEKLIKVGMSEIHVVRTEAQLSCLNLGSGVGVCALDPVSGVGGMILVQLSTAPAETPEHSLSAYANTGVQEMVARMQILGAERSRIKVAIAGGAEVGKFGGSPAAARLGERNVQTVAAEIQRLGLELVKSDTGGNLGRAVQFDTGTGAIRVRVVNRGERQLCSLREAA